jgi:transposase
MTHPNAPLSETGRLRLARCVVEDGWPLRRAAERFQVAPATAWRWADRYRRLGAAGMRDRSSKPHHSPRQTPTRTERRIIKVRVLKRWGPARIAYLLGLNPATVHRVLVRYRLPRLRDLDRATAVAVRRYEWSRPGELLHVDVKKLGNIPDGGGHKIHGRYTGTRNSTASAPIANNSTSKGAKLGYGYLHTAIDDHSRLAYTENLGDETKQTATAFMARALDHLAALDIRVERVLTDNGAPYRSHPWRPSARQGHQAQADPSLPAPDQRESRAVPPHPGRRMGLRPPLPVRTRTTRSASRVPALV